LLKANDAHQELILSAQNGLKNQCVKKKGEMTSNQIEMQAKCKINAKPVFSTEKLNSYSHEKGRVIRTTIILRDIFTPSSLRIRYIMLHYRIDKGLFMNRYWKIEFLPI